METDEKTLHTPEKITLLFRRGLHLLEQIIAGVTFVVLVAALGMEVFRMATVPGYFSDIETYLHSVLTIVVGLEFVRMLIHHALQHSGGADGGHYPPCYPQPR